jgi:subtilisin-like proprotein convertase family protein
VIVRDTLPPGVNFVSAMPSRGSCALSNTTVVCALGDMLRSTAESIAIVVQPLGSGRITNSLFVSSDLADFRPTNDTASVVSTVRDPGEFLNTDLVIMPDATPALPYPSVINVSGLAGVVSKVTVSLVELSHTFPADLDVMLAGPAGQRVMLMSDAGAGNAVNGVTLKFDDDAAITLPQSGQIFNGSYRPTDYEPGDPFIAPAPGGPFASALSAFVGANPNGVWSLYVTDDRGVDSGVLAGGWRLNILTMPGPEAPSLSVARAGGNLVISWPDTFGGFTLERTPSLSAPVTWTPVGIAPVQGGGRYTVTVPIAGGNAYFRLRAP